MLRKYLSGVGIIVLLILILGITQLSFSTAKITESDYSYYILAGGIATSPILDGFIATDEYGEGVLGTIIPVIDFSGTLDPSVINVTVYATHNDSHLFMAFQYYDATETGNGVRDGISIGFDEDEMTPFGVWSDSKFVLYNGDSQDYSILDWHQNMTSDGGPVADTSVGGTNDIDATGYYNDVSNTWIFEVLFPMDSGDTNGHDIVLESGDNVPFWFGIYQDNPMGGGSEYFNPGYSLAIDTPPPQYELRATEISITPIADGVITVDEYSLSSGNITVINPGNPDDYFNVTTYAAWKENNLYLAFYWYDIEKAVDTYDGMQLIIDQDEDGTIFTGVQDIKGVLYNGTADEIIIVDSYRELITSETPDTSNDNNGILNYDGEYWTCEMYFSLASGDSAGYDSNLEAGDVLNIMLGVVDQYNESTHYFGGMFGDNYKLIIEGTVIPEFTAVANISVVIFLFVIIISVNYSSDSLKKI